MQVRPQGLADAAQMKIELDQDKASALGVSLADINATMQTAFGSSYVNNFVNGPRVQRVIVQLDAQFRMTPEDIGKVYVRNKTGGMVPLSSFTNIKWTFGSPQLQRYNGIPAVNIVGAAAPGLSSGDAMLEMEKMAAQLPARHRLLVERPVAGRADLRQPGADALRHLAAHRFPLPRRAL